MTGDCDAFGRVLDRLLAKLDNLEELGLGLADDDPYWLNEIFDDVGPPDCVLTFW
jgi:hypothetical protein